MFSVLAWFGFLKKFTEAYDNPMQFTKILYDVGTFIQAYVNILMFTFCSIFSVHALRRSQQPFKIAMCIWISIISLFNYHMWTKLNHLMTWKINIYILDISEVLYIKTHMSEDSILRYLMQDLEISLTMLVTDLSQLVNLRTDF